MILFTSYQLLNRTYSELIERIDYHRTPVLGQGLDGTREAILDRFRKARNGILLLGCCCSHLGESCCHHILRCLIVQKLLCPGFATPAGRFHGHSKARHCQHFHHGSMLRTVCDKIGVDAAAVEQQELYRERLGMEGMYLFQRQADARIRLRQAVAQEPPMPLDQLFLLEQALCSLEVY